MVKVIFPGPNVGPEAALGTIHPQLGRLVPDPEGFEIQDEKLAAAVLDAGLVKLYKAGPVASVAQEAEIAPGDGPEAKDTTPRRARDKE